MMNRSPGNVKIARELIGEAFEGSVDTRSKAGLAFAGCSPNDDWSPCS